MRKCEEAAGKLRSIRQSRLVAKSQARAINKALPRVRTESLREVSRTEKVSQKVLRPRTRIVKASGGKVVGRFRFRFTGIPLHRLIQPARLSASIPRGTNKGGVRYRGTFYKSAFVNRVRRTGQVAVLQRVTSDARPLRMVKRPIRLTTQRSVAAHGVRVTQYEYPRLLAHELNRDLMRYVERFA